MVESTKDAVMTDYSATKEEFAGKLPTCDISNPDFENILKEQAATPATFEELE